MWNNSEFVLPPIHNHFQSYYDSQLVHMLHMMSGAARRPHFFDLHNALWNLYGEFFIPYEKETLALYPICMDSCIAYIEWRII